jgi:hypothetical protein
VRKGRRAARTAIPSHAIPLPARSGPTAGRFTVSRASHRRCRTLAAHVQIAPIGKPGTRPNRESGNAPHPPSDRRDPATRTGNAAVGLASNLEMPVRAPPSRRFPRYPARSIPPDPIVSRPDRLPGSLTNHRRPRRSRGIRCRSAPAVDRDAREWHRDPFRVAPGNTGRRSDRPGRRSTGRPRRTTWFRAQRHRYLP